MPAESDIHLAVINALGDSKAGAKIEEAEEIAETIKDLHKLAHLDPPEIAKVMVEAGRANRKALKPLFEIARLDADAPDPTLNVKRLFSAKGSEDFAGELEEGPEGGQTLEQILAGNHVQVAVTEEAKTARAVCDPNCPCTNTRSEISTSPDGSRNVCTSCKDCHRILGEIPLGANVNSELQALAELQAKADELKGAFGGELVWNAEENSQLAGKSLEQVLDGSSLPGQSLEEVATGSALTGKSLEEILGESAEA